MNKNKVKGHVAVFSANLFFGLNLPCTKDLLTNYVTPAGYMVLRSVGAALLFWTISFFMRRERVERKDLLLIAIGGILGFVISQYLTAVSLEYTTPVYFALITAMSPVIVMLFAALFLKEPITRQKAIGVILGVAGALLLIVRAGDDTGSGDNNLFGILLAAISITAFSIYLIIMRTVSPKYSPVTQMKWTYLTSSIVLLPLMFTALPDQPLLNDACTLKGWSEMLFVILFCTVVGYSLVPFGMKYLRATTVSIYMNLQPVVASIAAIIAGQDTFTWDKPISALLVIAGAYVVTTSPSKEDMDKSTSNL